MFADENWVLGLWISNWINIMLLYYINISFKKKSIVWKKKLVWHKAMWLSETTGDIPFIVYLIEIMRLKLWNCDIACIYWSECQK